MSPPPSRPAKTEGAATSSRQHAAALDDEICSSGGDSSRHRSAAKGHRGAKEQPTSGAETALLAPDGVPFPFRVSVTLWPVPQRAAEVVGVGGRADQQLRIGMRRLLRHVFSRAALDDLAGVHDQHLVSEVPGRCDVVGDVEHRQLEPRAQVVKQAQHLEPDRHVQHGDRLVGEQDARLGGERPGERDPLPLPAGELMRVLRQVLVGRGEPHLFHQVRRRLPDLG